MDASEECSRRAWKSDNRVSAGTVPAPLEAIDELLTLSQLQQLKASFDACARHQFALSDFTNAVVQIVPPSVTQGDITEWFGRIDVAGNGFVTWDDVSGYFVHRDQHLGKQDCQQFEYTKQHDQAARTTDEHHRDMVTCTLVHPHTGKVFTCGRDGIIKQWHQTTLQHEKILHNAGTYITSAGFLRHDTRLLVSSVDRQLNLFDVGTGNLLSTYVGRKHASDKKETHQRRHLSDTSKFGIKVDFSRHPQTSVGPGTTVDEFAGMMSKTLPQTRDPFEVSVTPLCDLCSPPMSQCCLEGPSTKESCALGLSDGYLQVYPLDPGDDGMCRHKCRFPLHTGSVSQLRYSNYLSGLISSSWDGSLKIFNFSKEVVSQTFAGPSGHQKAVFSFDWCEELQILASCGSERRVFIWNPFLSQPVFRIDGHQQPLVGVSLDYQHNQMLTLSEDKCIKVWDVRTFRCLQTVTDTVNYHPENSLSSLLFDAKRNRILTSATFPVAWSLTRVAAKESTSAGEQGGHGAPLVAVVAAPQLTGDRLLPPQLVTCDRGHVCSWGVETGRRRLDLRPSAHLHPPLQRLGHPISRAAADVRGGGGGGTRLFACTERGSVVAWSLQTGQIAAVGENPGASAECTALLHFRCRDAWCVAAALGPLLHIYADVEDVPQMRLLGRFCTTELSGAAAAAGVVAPAITALAQCGAALLALGLGDGRVALYNTDARRCSLVVLGAGLPRGSGSPVESMAPLTAQLLLVASGDGAVTLCDSAARRGAPLFNALAGRGGTVACMVLSLDRSIAFFGDSDGCVHVWRLGMPQPPQRRPSSSSTRTAATAAGEGDDTPSSAAAPAVPEVGETLVAQQVTVFQAHGDEVTAIACVAVPRVLEAAEQARECVATGGADCRVKLFTFDGVHIGTFGSAEGDVWAVHNEATWARASTEVLAQAAATSHASTDFFNSLQHHPPPASAAVAGQRGGRDASRPASQRGERSVGISLEAAASAAEVALPPPPQARQAFFIPTPPKECFGSFKETMGVLPMAKLQMRKQHCPLVNRRRMKAFGSVAAALVVAVAAVRQREEAALGGEAAAQEPAFITEVDAGKDDGTPTSQAAQRHLVEQRLARHGISLTVRGEREWLAKGAEVLRQIRRRKATSERSTGTWNRFSSSVKSTVRPIARPKAPPPPPNWKPSTCTLCHSERGRYGAKAPQAKGGGSAREQLPGLSSDLSLLPE